MLNSLITLVLFMLGIIMCASLVPLITMIMFKLKKSQKRRPFIYVFSSEVFEAEYPDASHWHFLNEQYEKKKLEEFSNQLP